MVYASKSRDYKGTFNDLKDFFKGENASELKFFNKFLNVLFADEESTMDFVFDIILNMTEPIGCLERDCKIIYGKFPYEIEEGVLKIKFKNKCSAQHWSPQNSGIEIKPEVLPTLYSLWKAVTNNHEQYGFAEMISFLSDYSGEHYIAPDKAGDKAEYMTELKNRGQEARQMCYYVITR